MEISIPGTGAIEFICCMYSCNRIFWRWLKNCTKRKKISIDGYRYGLFGVKMNARSFFCFCFSKLPILRFGSIIIMMMMMIVVVVGYNLIRLTQLNMFRLREQVNRIMKLLFEHAEIGACVRSRASFTRSFVCFVVISFNSFLLDLINIIW